MTILTKELMLHLENWQMEELKTMLEGTDPVQLIVSLRQMDNKEEQAARFRLLDKERALQVFEQPDADVQEDLLQSFAEEKALELIESWTGTTGTDCWMKSRKSGPIMAPQSLSPMTTTLMGHKAAVGRRLAEGPEHRRPGRKDRPVDVHGRHQGGDENRPKRCGPSSAGCRPVCRPHCGFEVRLVGIVTVDGAMDILDEETTEDIFDKAGLVNLTRAETTRSGLLVEWIPVSCLEGPAAFSAHHPCGRNAVSGIHS